MNTSQHRAAAIKAAWEPIEAKHAATFRFPMPPPPRPHEITEKMLRRYCA